MPQEKPLRASETLAFVPPSLAEVEGAPSFTLRSLTSDDKRFVRRLAREKRLVMHSAEAFREEVRLGLRALWTGEQFETEMPRLEAYWEHKDAFDAQVIDDPDMVWDFDLDEEKAVLDLIDRVAQAHAPLGGMEADNADYQELYPLFTMMVTVKGWTGLDTEVRRDRGYLTLDCVEEMLEELVTKSEGWLGKKERILPYLELRVACARRFRLDKETEKNSPSPSQDGSLQTSSKTASGPSASPEATDASSKSDKTKPSA